MATTTTTARGERNGSPDRPPILTETDAAPIQWRIAEALRTHELAVAHTTDVWCGRP